MFECIDKAVLFGFFKIAVSIKLATNHLDVCLVIYSAYEGAALQAFILMLNAASISTPPH